MKDARQFSLFDLLDDRPEGNAACLDAPQPVPPGKTPRRPGRIQPEQQPSFACLYWDPAWPPARCLRHRRGPDLDPRVRDQARHFELRAV